MKNWITAYDFPTAQFAEKAGMDMILVGDFLGMVVKGYKGTESVTMEDCIAHSQDVRRGAPQYLLYRRYAFEFLSSFKKGGSKKRNSFS